MVLATTTDDTEGDSVNTKQNGIPVLFIVGMTLIAIPLVGLLAQRCKRSKDSFKAMPSEDEENL